MFDYQRYKILLQQRDWAAIYQLLDDAREKAVAPDDVSCEVAFRVSTLREQRRYSDALDLLRDRGHLYTSQASATHDMARILLQLGRWRDALDVMSRSPYETEMTSCPIQATDAKFFHAVLLAKAGDASAIDLLRDIPDDYMQVTVNGDDLITKSNVVAWLDAGYRS